MVAEGITKHAGSSLWAILADLLELLNSLEVRIDCFLLVHKQGR